MSSFSLLEKLNKGWYFPYRSKSWHYFKNGKSLCSKHTITLPQEGGLLPALNPHDKICKACYKQFTKEEV